MMMCCFIIMCFLTILIADKSTDTVKEKQIHSSVHVTLVLVTSMLHIYGNIQFMSEGPDHVLVAALKEARFFFLHQIITLHVWLIK